MVFSPNLQAAFRYGTATTLSSVVLRYDQRSGDYTDKAVYTLLESSAKPGLAVMVVDYIEG